MDGNHLISLQLPPMPYYICTGLTTLRPGEQHPSRRNLGLFDLLWVVRGVLYIGEEERQWEVAEGQTLLLLPDRYHYAVRPCDTETVFYWVHFDYRGTWSQEGDPAAFPPSPVRLTWANPYTVRLRQYAAPADTALGERHLQQLLHLADQHRSAAYWSEQQLFMELLRLLEEGQAEEAASPSRKLAEKTEAYLRQHYQADVTNQSLAAALHFHPNYIVRSMKEIYHCTPMEYLHQYRLEQAKLLLIKTEWPVAQIAERVGFHYAPYFSSCFKQYIGITPLRFRKQYSP
ncbi:helix-turn-helix transcriptional regulator [Paenibacillus caseinilyticus]|uniref:AraC family transcriptional regulator n=1 Tax=Paenibacillus mucilaginosus K02 TaxID=997761 RepID=I0BMC7_9BACL|nr:AraC family transcriptional regulator [Paenibacillus mucilaginosus]AFH63524.1 AraC family transcriptional regulator [Paenibacillus mucilaginosus K02]WFA19774.1 AraC family transcriptional regulator [Paenibacillus mucilaginosus]